MFGGVPGGEQDGRWISLRGDRPARPAAEVAEEARAACPGVLLAEPRSADGLADLARLVDGFVVGGAWTRDLSLVRAVAAAGLPVVVQRGSAASLGEWLAVADYCAAAGNDRVVLCESGGRGPGGRAAPNLPLLRAARERSGRPVLADLGEDPGLAAAAVAAGADGLFLAPQAGPGVVAAARRAALVVGALAGAAERRGTPGSVEAAREAIDRVDAALATLLERRAALAGVVQRLKPVGGFAGRDMDRERRLVEAMARYAPRLGAVRLAPVMNAVIEAGLHLAEEDRRLDRPAP
ncbi:hypothetical protein Misp01_73240 [Microtetraspora sp. NBRC 13810]|nr:hypothetical protein Misp01_73240 [Microtetraspora sp. NBRC 13810]